MVELSGRTVVAAFKHRAQAQRAVDALLDAGFEEMSIAIEASDEWHHHEQDAVDALSADVEPDWSRAPARWPVPAGAFLGGMVAAAAAWLSQRRRAWWQRGGWARGEIAMVAAGAVLGAAGGLALITAWRRRAPADGELYVGVEYDQGSLERGHAIVAVAPGERLADAEALLRTFGGRGVHLRAPQESESSDVDATVRMDTVA